MISRTYGPERRLCHKEVGDSGAIKVAFRVSNQPDGSTVLKREKIEQTEGMVGWWGQIVPDPTTPSGRRATKAVLAISEVIRYFEEQVKKDSGPKLKNGKRVGGGYRKLIRTNESICGVCPPPYGLAAAKAIEHAFGVTISEQAALLRELMLCGNHFDSHAVHSVGLALIAMLGATGVIQLHETLPEPVTKLLSLYSIGNRIITSIGGRSPLSVQEGGDRSVHPITIVPGGLNVTDPDTVAADLQFLLTELCSPEIDEAYELLVTLYADAQNAFLAKYPVDLSVSPHEFISLTQPNRYAFYDGVIGSDVAGDMTHEEYVRYILETVSDETTAKLVHTRNETFDGMFSTGARVRLRRNRHLLHAKTHAVLERLQVDLDNCYSWWTNTAAQIAEMNEVRIRMIEIMKTVLSRGLVYECNPDIAALPKRTTLSDDERTARTQERHVGIGIVEAPRGTMLQHYVFDGLGDVIEASCVIPTGKNQVSIGAELTQLLQRCLDLGWEYDKIQQFLDIFMRHPDFCCSCAVHFLIRDGVRTGHKSGEFRILDTSQHVSYKKPAIIAVGNVLQGNDAIAHMVLPLVKKQLSLPHVTYVDGGVNAFHALCMLKGAGYDKIIFIDAAKGFSEHAGYVRTLTEAELVQQAAHRVQTFSAHDSSLVEAVRLVRIGKYDLPDNIETISIEVMGIRSGAELQRVAQRAAEHVVHELEHLLGVTHGHTAHQFVMSASVCTV
jgi:sulfhydrogenase subunit alpha